MNVTDSTILDMEKFHAKNAKMFQGLPENSCNVGSLKLIGWPTMRAYMDICRLLFIWKVLLLPGDNIYKICMIQRIVFLVNRPPDGNHGPLWGAGFIPFL